MISFNFEETPSSDAIDEDEAAMLLNDVESDVFILSAYECFALSTRDTVSTLVCWSRVNVLQGILIFQMNQNSLFQDKTEDY